LFEKEGVEIIGVILNQVLDNKVDYVTDFARRGLKRKGLELLGVIPHQTILSQPTMDLVREELDAEVVNNPPTLHAAVEDVVVGAMGAQNAQRFFKRGVLLITPGDREDILAAACATGHDMAGIVLTGGLKPGSGTLRALRGLQLPVMLAQDDSYVVASKVHDLTVKTRPDDAEKISLIRDIVARNVNLKTILDSL
jgi:BioD-like phosphotransacetylase family protein